MRNTLGTPAADARPRPSLPLVVERCRAGDETSFRELYMAYRRQVTAQLSHLLPRSELEDAVQEVFVEVFRSIRRFEGRSAFDTWLYRVALNVAMRWRRKRSRALGDADLPDGPPDLPDPGAAPDDCALARERTARVEALLLRLSPKKRAVLVLHEVRGLAPAQIAQLVGSNALTVRTRLFYARREFERMAAAEPLLAEFFALPGAEKERT